MNSKLSSKKYDVTARYPCKIPKQPSEENIYFGPPNDGLRKQFYRLPALNNTIGTIFDADDPSSYTNWLTTLGTPDPIHRNKNKPIPRIRELNDPQYGVMVFEITGMHNGSISIQCPPICDASLGESLPILNLVMSDMGGYSSVEIEVQTMDEDDIMGYGEDFFQTKRILARNYRSRASVDETELQVPMKLMGEMSYVYLDLAMIVQQAWGFYYYQTMSIKINANTRLRRVFFSEKVLTYDELPKQFKLKPHFPIVMQNILEFGKTKCPTWKLKEDDPIKLIKERIEAEKEYEKKHNTKPFILKDEIPQENRIRASSISLTSRHGEEPLLQVLTRAIQNNQSDNDKDSQRIVTKITRASDPILGDHMEAVAETQTDPVEFNTESFWPFLSNVDDAFCAQILNQDTHAQGDDEGEADEEVDENPEPSVPEWDAIMSFDGNPRDLSRFQRLKQSAGLYDIYSAKMVTETDATIYESESPRRISSTEVEEVDIIMQDQDPLKVSITDPESYLGFLKTASTKFRKMSEGYDGEDEDADQDQLDLNDRETPSACRSVYSNSNEDIQIEKEESTESEEPIPEPEEKKPCYGSKWTTWKCDNGNYQKTLLLHDRMMKNVQSIPCQDHDTVIEQNNNIEIDDNEGEDIVKLPPLVSTHSSTALTPNYFKTDGKLNRFVETIMSSYVCKNHIVR